MVNESPVQTTSIKLNPLEIERLTELFSILIKIDQKGKKNAKSEKK